LLACIGCQPEEEVISQLQVHTAVQLGPHSLREERREDKRGRRTEEDKRRGRGKGASKPLLPPN
jgi:hypothetical protein